MHLKYNYEKNNRLKHHDFRARTAKTAQLSILK